MTMAISWRDRLAPVIAKVIAEVGREEPKRLRAALRDAYPCGERKYWPYKVWCDEVRRQLGIAHVGISAREHRATGDLFA